MYPAAFIDQLRAQLLLSQMYEKGQEVTKDPKKAAYWKKKYEKNPAKKEG